MWKKKKMDIEIALRRTLEKMEKTPYSILETNHRRHRFVLCSDGTKMYFMYKNEPLHLWKELFPQLNAIGKEIVYVDSINVPLYYEAQEKYFKNKTKETYIIICYPDKTILKIPFQTWLERADEKMLYRRTNNLEFVNKADGSGKTDYVEEKTMSCYFKEEDVVNRSSEN